MQALKPGELIAERYRLERSIGRGGMGVVFLAAHEALGRKVAIKFLDLSTDGSPETLERFSREGRAAATIAHPGIVDVLDLGTTPEGTPFLVMEFIEGPTLRELTDRVGALEPRLASAVLVPVLEALEAAHAAGVVHRDLKPANVMLALAPRREVKLLDFGLAKLLRSSAVITRTGAAMGTPSYMSPEQTTAAKAVTGASDLYSVGVMLFELLSGRLPFNADTVMETMVAVARQAPPPMVTVVPGLDPRLTRLVDSLLVKDPAARPGSAAEVRAALIAAAPPDVEGLWARVGAPLAGGLDPTAPRRAVFTPSMGEGPEPVLQPTHPSLQRRLRPSTIALGAVAAVAVVLGFSVWESRQELDALRPAVGRARAVEPAVEPPKPPEAKPQGPITAEPVKGVEPGPKGTPEERARNADAIHDANEALVQGELGAAWKALRECKVGDAVCPEGKDLLARIQEEENFKLKLDKAALAIEQREPGLASQLLLASEGTRAYRARHRELQERLDQLAKKAPAVPADTQGACLQLLEAAKTQAKTGRYTEARASLEQCLQLDRDQPECHRLLGMAFARENDTVAARAHLEAFVKLAPRDHWAPAVRKILKDFDDSATRGKGR